MARVIWWKLDHGTVEPPTSAGVELHITRYLQHHPEIVLDWDVLIAEAHNLFENEVRKSLHSVLQLPARPPVLLLTSSNPVNMRSLPDLLIDDLAWTSESGKEVMARAIRLVKETELQRVAGRFVPSLSTCRTIETALQELFFGADPVARVEDLASRCNVSRSTLWREWVKSRSGNHPACLKTLVDWCLLLRARELHRRGLSPVETARTLGVHERTLDRIANRSAGLTFPGLLNLESGQFEQLVDQRLLGRRRKSKRPA